MQPPLLMAFSQQRWSSGHQRAQHLLSRLAGRWRVLFVEAPVHATGTAWLEEQRRGPQLTVLVPHMPPAPPGLPDEPLSLLRTQLDRYLLRTRQRVDVAWLDSPLALPVAQSVRAPCLVYDCMDPMTAGNGAPLQLHPHEAALLRQATLVLTGGPSLYEARRDQHAQVVCLPSAVDAGHYAPEQLQMHSAPACQVQLLQGGLPRPRLGFFGSIDERFDGELVAQIADAHPEWTLVMAGPLVGIDAGALPQRPNIHWLGPQPYARLPYLLAGWELCLMPFALNESTRYFSPSETLQYMAGGKPVLSTPVHDVAWLYSDAVAIAPRGQPFVEACEALLSEAPAARAQRELQMLSAVSASSWDRSAQAVHELLLPALADAREGQRPLPLAAAAPHRAATR